MASVGQELLVKGQRRISQDTVRTWAQAIMMYVKFLCEQDLVSDRRENQSHLGSGMLILSSVRESTFILFAPLMSRVLLKAYKY